MRFLSTVLSLTFLISSHAMADAIKSRDGTYSFNLYLTREDAAVLNHKVRFVSTTQIDRVSCNTEGGCVIAIRPRLIQTRSHIREMIKMSDDLNLPTPRLTFWPENDDEVLIIADVPEPKVAHALFNALKGDDEVRSINLVQARFQLECKKIRTYSGVAHGCTAMGIFPSRVNQPAILTLASSPAS